MVKVKFESTVLLKKGGIVKTRSWPDFGKIMGLTSFAHDFVLVPKMTDKCGAGALNDYLDVLICSLVQCTVSI